VKSRPEPHHFLPPAEQHQNDAAPPILVLIYIFLMEQVQGQGWGKMNSLNKKRQRVVVGRGERSMGMPYGRYK
jgi:hypothetical protein